MRTKEEILAQINADADSHSELSELQSNTSKVSFWKMAKEVMAFAIWWLEGLLSSHMAEVQSIVDSTEIGTQAWYVGKALAYQYGDQLTYNNNVLGYGDSQSEEAQKKRIIQKASVVEDDSGLLTFKLLKASNATLSAEEQAGFASYMRKMKVMGTRIAIVSGEAVAVAFAMSVELDEQVFDSDGKRKKDHKKAVEEAITDYLSSVPFDGVFFVSKLEDAIQAVAGVVDVSIPTAQKNETGNWTDIQRKFNPSTGWMRTDFGEGVGKTKITYITS